MLLLPTRNELARARFWDGPLRRHACSQAFLATLLINELFLHHARRALGGGWGLP